MEQWRHLGAMATFECKSSAFDLLSMSKNLKDDEHYHSVFVVPDRSREERIEH